MTKTSTARTHQTSRRHAVLLAVCAAALCITATVQAASPIPRDRLVYKQHLDSRPVTGEIMFYSYPSGSGGYFTIQNTSSQDRKYRVRIILNDGNSTTRVVHARSGRFSGNASFSYAGFNRQGIDRVELLYSRPE